MTTRAALYILSQPLTEGEGADQHELDRFAAIETLAVALGLREEAVLAHARATLASYKRPKGVEIWPELPKSSANKILRRSVRDQIVARLETAISEVPSRADEGVR